ncbi:MAG: TfoX/Sxy family protein, partial [Candidatus Dadabacteria bacterium]|nr:TfoX/Sxy family protein [Candidatus Dadabacteria bacterium]
TIAGLPGMKEKRMFGGICYMLNGNMCVGIYKDNVIVRIGEDIAEKIMKEPHVKPMDIAGKAMKGWAMVGSDGIVEDKSLKRFCSFAIEFVLTLSPK